VTLALVMGLYASAQARHFSGPLASGVAGRLIGHRGRAFARREAKRQHLDTFWELVDDILNALLVTLIGLEALVVSLEMNHIIAVLAAVVVALAARPISISVPVALLVQWRNCGKGTIRVMGWGGLHGGISVATCWCPSPSWFMG
ncbi:cation:proton antiporter, partial [Oceanidesulfovibrio marinus]